MSYHASQLSIQKPDIISILDREGIEYRRKGRDYWIKHHGEKTASCKVSTEHQTFHCFGCGTHGDVIDLVMELHGLNFKDACQYLHIMPGQPVQIDPARQRQRELLKQFEKWRVSFYCRLCNERIELDRIKYQAQNRKPLPEYLGFWLAEQLARLPFIEYMLDILSGHDDELKFKLYRSVNSGTI